MSNTEPLTPSHARKVSYLMTRLVDVSESACWYGHQCTIDDTYATVCSRLLQTEIPTHIAPMSGMGLAGQGSSTVPGQTP